MAIPQSPNLQGPRHRSVQPMVKYCPTCRGGLEVMASNNQTDFAHNYWCSVCGRVFEINYLGRDLDLDEAWIEAATAQVNGET